MQLWRVLQIKINYCLFILIVMIIFFCFSLYILKFYYMYTHFIMTKLNCKTINITQYKKSAVLNAKTSIKTNSPQNLIKLY